MDKNREAAEDAMAHARYEQEMAEQLDEQGLCLACEEAPQNPNISGKVCLDCWNKHKAVGCQHQGCPNSPDGTFRHAQYCSIHLADRAHKAYESYLVMKGDIEEREKRLNERIEEAGIDPRETSIPPKEWDDTVEDLDNDLISLRLDEHELAEYRKLVEDVIEQLDETFPEEYEVFG